jgi:hypothetical protein
VFAAPIDSFWKDKPTFVQPAHVLHINETKPETTSGKRRLVQQRAERRSIEAKIVTQCAAESSAAPAKKLSTEPNESPPSKPRTSQYFEDSNDQEQLLQHAATMLLFTQAVAKEQSSRSGQTKQNPSDLHLSSQ